jgi:hypothetical protein
MIVFYTGFAAAQKDIYQVASGTIRFHSDAPLEMIRAASKNLVGAVDVSKRTFLFRISITSFQGFNSPRQKEHFNENYMESDLHPLASYSGKIIEDVDFTKDGEYNIRAKGKFTIHGVERQRIIKCHIICRNGTITVQSDFIVLLADHNIKIPRIVSDKLSPEINVSVNLVLAQKPSS